MAFSATTLHPVVKADTGAAIGSDVAPSLLSMLILSMYAAKKSRKAMRKMQHQLAWHMVKEKARSLFSKREGVSNRTLLYILLAVIFLVILALSPIAALAVAVLLLILYLAGVIKV